MGRDCQPLHLDSKNIRTAGIPLSASSGTLAIITTRHWVVGAASRNSIPETMRDGDLAHRLRILATARLLRAAFLANALIDFIQMISWERLGPEPFQLDTHSNPLLSGCGETPN
jgi:hypothetical protein